MDSGNSGSLQSSSGGGGDEEYDSRANAMFLPGQLPPSIFDPFTDYRNPTVNIAPWTSQPGSLRSDPDSNQQSNVHHPMMTSSSSGGLLFQQAAENPNPNPTAARNPKKRSRASRRAPTTVLTTDTTNFRAMVQEFTGIPATPPFSSNSSFSSAFPIPRTTRLDLLGTRSPPYFRRPFTQKVQSPVPEASLFTSAITTNSNSTSGAAVSTGTPAVNYQSQLPLPTSQNSNFFNAQNPFLQPNSKFLFPTSGSSSYSKPPSAYFSPNDEYFLEESGSGSLIGLISRDNQINEGFQNGIFTSAGSNFHGEEKVPENIPIISTARGEGTSATTLDSSSWIFSSD